MKPAFVLDSFRVPLIGRGKGRRILGVLAILTAGLVAVQAQPPAAPAAAPAPAANAVVEAAPETDLAKSYADGLASFAKGDYAAAASAMDTIIAQAPPEAPLETVYYTLGAAQFNLQQYDKAIEALRKYIEKYPKAAKIDDATFFIGQCQIQLKDFAGAAKTLAPLEAKPNFGEQILLMLATANKEAGKTDAAIAGLTKLTAGGLHTPYEANGAMLLASIYAQKGDSEKAIALLKEIRKNTALLDNLMRMNALAIEQGDTLLKAEKPEAALNSYQLVQSRDEVIRQQNDRLAAMQRRIDENLVAVRADPTRVTELSAANDQIRRLMVQTKDQLAAFEKTPDFEGPLWLRVAQAYYGMQRQWEAATVYDELIRRYPEGVEREPALFGLIVASADTNRGPKIRELCELYLKEFPKGPNADTVSYLLGASMLQGGDTEGAITYFGHALETQPASTFREEMLFLLGNARFGLNDFANANDDYDKYLAAYPSGAHKEEVLYRKALATLFAGKYEDAIKQINDYIQAYPSGEFLPDAKYRLGVCYFAASQYDTVIKGADAWLEEFPGNGLKGEVLALKGDALASLPNKENETIDAYVASGLAAETDEVRSHSLMEAAKLMQKQGQWEKLGSMFEQFVKDHPDSTVVVPAVFWIGKAKAKEGKSDEAKQFVASVIQKNIADPKQDAVEQLLSQLAQFCVKKKPAAVLDPSASPAPSATPPADPGAELDGLLGHVAGDSPTAKARVLFAKAELARLRRNPTEADKNLAAIAATTKPQDLSPVLLAQVGDYLLSVKDYPKAETFFKQLVESYPKSDYLDYAYNGFGEIAYAQKDYPKALAEFTGAVAKTGAPQKLREVTVGQAKTLLALGRLDEAKKLFEQVASTREWRGDATAFSVYSLGEIEEKKGKLAEAIAFYQRVYVAYAKYLDSVAKAYIRSAECFEKLGKTQEAINTYREMIRNDKLAAYPEYAQARKKLEAIGN